VHELARSVARASEGFRGAKAATVTARIEAVRAELEAISAQLGIEAERAWAVHERRVYHQAENAGDAIDKAAASVDDALRQLQG
jgi:uncharacterized protein with PIN domain